MPNGVHAWQLVYKNESMDILQILMDWPRNNDWYSMGCVLPRHLADNGDVLIWQNSCYCGHYKNNVFQFGMQRRWKWHRHILLFMVLMIAIYWLYVFKSMLSFLKLSDELVQFLCVILCLWCLNVNYLWSIKNLFWSHQKVANAKLWEF